MSQLAIGQSTVDQRFMAAALRLSRWHLGQTDTNPSVGCLIVRDDGDGPYIVGRAVTAIGGRPHAETQALLDAGDRARGATAYVTLEPCSHHGKTPPCVDALIAAGITRVVVSADDPDARVSGRGFQMLKDAGIGVVTGVLADEGARALHAYLTRQTLGRPHVTLKLAVSADGMIGRSDLMPGQGQVAITGPLARAQSQVLRAESDSILIGIGTALADDPDLTCRLPGLENRSPLRIVLDRHLRLPVNSRLVESAGRVPLMIVTEQADQDRCMAYRDQGAEVVEAQDLATLLTALSARGVSSLIVEGGARIARAFLDADLVDHIMLFMGAAAIGPSGVVAPIHSGAGQPGFALVRSAMFGPDRCDEFERVA